MDEEDINYSGPATDTTDEEDDTEESGTPEAQAAAASAGAATAQPGQPLVMQGGQGAVQVPPAAAPGYENAQQLANRAMWQQLRYRFAQSPLAETEAAVGAALKYQALRAYQNDVAQGVNAGKALTRVAPLLGAPNLSHAAAFIRATAPESPKLMDVGGILYRNNGDGSVTAITSAKPQRQQANQFDLAEYKNTLAELTKKQNEASDDILGSPQFNKHQADIALLRGQLSAIRRRVGTQTVTTGAPNPVTGRIRVRHPNGQSGTISAAALPRALKLGYSRIQ
jgi:hypothetical protein